MSPAPRLCIVTTDECPGRPIAAAISGKLIVVNRRASRAVSVREATTFSCRLRPYNSFRSTR